MRDSISRGNGRGLRPVRTGCVLRNVQGMAIAIGDGLLVEPPGKLIDKKFVHPGGNYRGREPALNLRRRHA